MAVDNVKNKVKN